MALAVDVRRALPWILLAVPLCVASGVALAAGGSVAVGRTNGGSLRNGADVLAGDAPVELLPRCRKRGLHWATDELTGALHRAARRVTAAHPGSVLALGNLSAPRGGPISFSVSHQNGLDADLAPYMRDASGRPVPAPDYLHFGADLRSREHGGSYRFDVSRTWDLVAALLSDDRISVQWLFVSSPIRAALLTHGRKVGAPSVVMDRAARVLHQPSDAPPHDDHLHLRIYCPAEDRRIGCVDRGPTWPWLR